MDKKSEFPRVVQIVIKKRDGSIDQILECRCGDAWAIGRFLSNMARGFLKSSGVKV